ncbi:MAG TPA: hypothetical protein VFV38_07020 [Ktedonobacteraceae bacterium]|nr:hypothetical protein [Ktedonobacteraceae bacterium]
MKRTRSFAIPLKRQGPLDTERNDPRMVQGETVIIEKRARGFLGTMGHSWVD